MQDPMMQSERDAFHTNGNLPAIPREPAAPRGLEAVELRPPAEIPRGEPSTTETPSPLQDRGLPAQRQAFFPQRGLYYATITGVIAGVLAALLTIVITLVNAGTFHSATQQIAADKLTVRTALALAAWETLTFLLSLLIGFCVGMIVGRIAIRRRLGFLAGALAGAVFSLLIFFVSLISGYPGNLAVHGPTITSGSLMVSFLLLCLWTLGGGLVSLFGTWVMTVRHPYYLSH